MALGKESAPVHITKADPKGAIAAAEAARIVAEKAAQVEVATAALTMDAAGEAAIEQAKADLEAAQAAELEAVKQKYPNAIVSRTRSGNITVDF